MEFTELLCKELQKPLPGKEVQFEMAAGNRIFYKETQYQVAPREGSVLIILYPVKSEWFTIFIKRTQDKGPHSGQMAFPGGIKETKDKSFFDTALREAEEEVGIDLKQITYVGKLTPLHIPVSNILVHPFIGTLNQKPLLKKNKDEVAEIFEISLKVFLNKNILSFLTFEFKGNTYKAPCFVVGNYNIWGATAMMWNEFLTIYKNIIVNESQ